MTSLAHKALQDALTWYVEHGVDDVLAGSPVNRLLESPQIVAAPKAPASLSARAAVAPPPAVETLVRGASGAREEAARLVRDCKNLEDLRAAIADFDGLAIKKTATNLVFADGNPKSPVMLVGEAPGADEDRLGKPFVGASGQLLDRILKCIDLDRAQEDPARAVYISNVLNWRPPGNRTPSPAEIDVSLPFIEKHILLVKPKLLILCGGVSAKALLASGESVSKLRRQWHDWRPQTAELGYDGPAIPAIATYHPAYLLRTPSQKKAVWADMLAVEARRAALVKS